MTTRCLAPAILWFAAAASGCGAEGPTTIPVRGEVTLNGAPLKDGIVAYIPAGGEARQATGRIQPDGTFVLTTFKNADGVVPGDYQIVIYAYATGPGEPLTRVQHEAMARTGELERPSAIPEKYANPHTSGLSDTVNADHSGFKKIELSG
jgi:hypothetical protein